MKMLTLNSRFNTRFTLCWDEVTFLTKLGVNVYLIYLLLYLVPNLIGRIVIEPAELNQFWSSNWIQFFRLSQEKSYQATNEI